MYSALFCSVHVHAIVVFYSSDIICLDFLYNDDYGDGDAVFGMDAAASALSLVLAAVRGSLVLLHHLYNVQLITNHLKFN